RGIAERFADIKAALRRRGISKSDVDLLIAATALELDATLATNDQALHDGTITGLRVEDWLAV
ncbi:MAG: PIN domain-containing protein, partial [Pseudomonadota bacterium]